MSKELKRKKRRITSWEYRNNWLTTFFVLSNAILPTYHIFRFGYDEYLYDYMPGIIAGILGELIIALGIPFFWLGYLLFTYVALENVMHIKAILHSALFGYSVYTLCIILDLSQGAIYRCSIIASVICFCSTSKIYLGSDES